MTEKTIVKVQISLATNQDQKRALIYAMGRKSPEEINYLDLPKKVIKDLGVRVKAFYYAKRLYDVDNKFIGWSLQYQAPWQEW